MRAITIATLVAFSIPIVAPATAWPINASDQIGVEQVKYKYKWKSGGCKYEYKADKKGFKEKYKCK